MSEMLLHDQVPGFEAPVHRALTEPILLGGAPRAVAITNGTLAAAVGLGLRLWIAGLLLWAIGHWRRSGPQSATRSSSMSCGGICVIPRISACKADAMFNLAEYRKKPKMLADFLPWAALVAPGVVLNKDGSFQRSAQFRGPDLDSATPAELVGTTARLNNALRRLGSGWAIFVEASRVAAQRYPQSRFPDPVSNLVDAERRAQFEEAGAHFESAYYLTLLWLPPSEEASRAERWLYEGRSRKTGGRCP